jgi:hypothetical protein
VTRLRFSDLQVMAAAVAYFGEELPDRVPAEGPSLAGREQWLVGLAFAFFEPGAQDRDHLAGHGRNPFLASLADHPHASAAAEARVGDAEGGQFRDTQTGF